MRIYAIKELNTDLFVTRQNDLAPLGAVSRFFETQTAAMRALEYQDDYGFFRSDIKDDIAWHQIEKERRLDRWHIDMSWKEFRSYLDDIDLKVVAINISESKRRS